MVFSEELTAMGTERSSSSSSKPLHNFTLPYLKWGHQRHLRCMKVEDSSAVDQLSCRRSSSSKLFGREFDGLAGCRRKGRKDDDEEEEEEEDEGIEAVRKKIMNDLKTAATKMKHAILREEVYGGEEEREEESRVAAASEASAASAVESEVRPWNLRTRRSACKAPPNNKGLFRIEEEKKLPNSSPIIGTDVGAKSPRLLRGEKEIKKERPKFAVNLMRKEIEEDFMEMLGHRPPRRPKKRARNVQKQLDTLFPGLWLTEVTVDLYKVPELAENGGKR